MAQLILEKIDLLGDANLRCPSVIKVEGLHSYKAIAFIRSKSNPKASSLKTKTYSKLRISLQKSQLFSENIFSVRNPIREYFNKQLGDEKWIK
jgi:hypothetical protein